MNTGLPKTACIGGRCFRIRSDFREILDICAALNDPELTDQDRAEVAVKIFYPDWDQITDMAAAVKFMLWFWMVVWIAATSGSSQSRWTGNRIFR